jgi:hypothetical protein
VSINDALQPAPHLRDGIVHPPLELGLHGA